MIEGVDHDDKYRMVEDEFLSVAGDFTRHLHAAEYQRLKNLTDSQNAEAIKTISRPVTGDMTDLVKRRHAALDRATKQRKAVASVLGKREESDDPQMAMTLQGLMDSPRKKAVPLASLSSVTMGSRAEDASPSRRFGRNGGVELRLKQEPESDDDDGDDDDEDDLDGPSRFRVPRRSTLPVSTPAPERAVDRPPRAETWQTGPRNSGSSRPARPQLVPVKAEPEDDDDDDPFVRMRARREEQRRRRESNKIKHETAEDPKSLLNEIPFI